MMETRRSWGLFGTTAGGMRPSDQIPVHHQVRGKGPRMAGSTGFRHDPSDGVGSLEVLDCMDTGAAGGAEGCPVAITSSPGTSPGPMQGVGMADCGVSAMFSRDDGHL